MLGTPSETTQLCYICGLEDDGWEFNWQPLPRAELRRHSATLWPQPDKADMLESLFQWKYPEPTAASAKRPFNKLDEKANQQQFHYSES